MKPKEHEYSSHVAYTRALEEYCAEQAAWIEKLRAIIRNHVESSNNDDSAVDTFAVLMESIATPTDSKQILAEYRNKTLEDAAVKCDEIASDGDTYGMQYAADCAETIRAMKETK